MVWFSAGTCVSFVINKNMTVVTKQLQYPPLNNKLCWNFATRGDYILSEDRNLSEDNDYLIRTDQRWPG